ncbi:hypothetical protein ACIQOU_12100 [Streptomyces sp. NPDC091279]|uniref:hypothetical protein n=1 Tax=Streptomyces sp. NPDC091279 TaxID=3365983 RepID=UPI003830E852
MSIRSSEPDRNDAPISAPNGGDPLSAVVHAAVADRPLEEVAHLITLLEQSPQYAQATVDALRAVGTTRSVEDVTRLVTLLTQPPRDPGCADEAIRAAAETRPVEEVTRLMTLLRRTPLQPHCGAEAARIAATARPVEDLVELIGRMSEERYNPDPVPKERAGPIGEDLADDDALPPMDDGRAPRRIPRSTTRPSARRHLMWPNLVAAGVLLLCALLWFPLYREGGSLRAYGFAVGVSVLCALVAGALTLRAVLPVLAAAVVVPALLAAAQLFEGRFHSAQLSQALALALAPSWAAGLVAVCASLAALVALLVRLTWQPPLLEEVPRPLAQARPAGG